MGPKNIDARNANIGIVGDHGHIENYYASRKERIPLQKPLRAEYFTGREIELNKLLTDLQPGKVATLCGPGGMGKTALAAEAIWTMAPGDEAPERFPDGIVFYSFYGKPGISLAFDHILRSYDEYARDFSTEAVRRLMGQKKALVILDGAEEAADLTTVLDVCSGKCGVLVTTRNKDDAPGDIDELSPLGDDEAATLLQDWGKKWAENDKAVREICILVGGLPLALRIAGAYLAHRKQKAEEYLKWLEKSPLKALDQGNRRKESVRVLFDKSIANVTEEERDVLSVVGGLALAPFSPEAIFNALGLDEVETNKILGNLVRISLLQRNNDRYTVTHALIYTYIHEMMKIKAENMQRMASYYSHFVKKMNSQGAPGFFYLDREKIHILRILDCCIESGNLKTVVILVNAIDHFLDIQGYWRERTNSLNSGIKASKNLHEKKYEARFTNSLGLVYFSLGQAGKAIEYYEQALAISREIGDRKGEGFSLGSLGNAYRSLGQVEKGIEYSTLDLEITREIRDQRGESAALMFLGIAYSDLGQVEKAIEYYTQALAISRDIGNRHAEGAALGNLGNAYDDLGQTGKGIEYNEQALAISKEIGNRRGEAIDLGNLGVSYAALGQMEKAFEHYMQALAIAREIGDRKGEGFSLGSLGLAYSALGQVEKAIEFHMQALDISREIGDRRGEGNDLGNLGLAFVANKQIEKAIEFHMQALDISRETGDRRGEAYDLGNLGEAFAAQRKFNKAMDYFKESLDISREIKDRSCEGIQLWNLGNVYSFLNQMDNASQLFMKALEIFNEIGSPLAEKARIKIAALHEEKTSLSFQSIQYNIY